MEIKKQETGELVDGVKVYKIETTDAILNEITAQNPELMKQEVVRYRTYDLETRLPEIMAERGQTMDDLKRILKENRLPIIAGPEWDMFSKDPGFQMSLHILHLKMALGIHETDLQVVHEFVNPRYVQPVNITVKVVNPIRSRVVACRG